MTHDTTLQSTGQSLTRSEAEDFLYREGRLLDELELETWLSLFHTEGSYWLPIDEDKPVSRNISLISDDHAALQERVFHLLHTPFPAQTPRSRTIHFVSNVEVENKDDSVVMHSSQLIYEVRTGNFRQTGLGDVRPLVARVRHELRPDQGSLKIWQKKVLLIDRDMPQGNLTFLI